MSQEQIDAHLRIKAIEILDSELHHPKIPDFNPQKVSFAFNLESKVNAAIRCIFIVVNINVNSEDNKLLLAKMSVNFVFEIENFEEVIKEKDQKFDIPEQIIHLLNTISVSTLRGIMYERFRGTFLHNFLIPIIHGRSLLPQKK
jgi:hypothetical protein